MSYELGIVKRWDLLATVLCSLGLCITFVRSASLRVATSKQFRADFQGIMLTLKLGMNIDYTGTKNRIA